MSADDIYARVIDGMGRLSEASMLSVIRRYIPYITERLQNTEQFINVRGCQGFRRGKYIAIGLALQSSKFLRLHCNLGPQTGIRTRLHMLTLHNNVTAGPS
jgi:hypothetical protein